MVGLHRSKCASWGWVAIALGPSVPSGAVLAFHGECPNGSRWEPYQLGAGRFLLGADKTREDLPLHKKDGHETHTLTVPEMPTHNHDNDGKLLLVSVTGDGTAEGSDKKNAHIEFNLGRGYSMIEMGGGQPHNNMPPYLVVNFCKKK